jgi:predicted O-methyltransferase YrrM
MRNISHWTPQYLYNRLAVTFYEKQHPESPWLTSSAISILSKYLKSTDIGLEWGSGRSTAWFASKVKNLVSVENNLDWYKQVNHKLQVLDLNNVDYKYIENIEQYVKVVDLFEDNSLDFALVDGCPSDIRDECAVKVLDKIKNGGCIIVDNVNWFLPSNSNSPNSRSYESGAASEHWNLFLEYVQNWRNIWTTNGVTDTAFFIKS